MDTFSPPFETQNQESNELNLSSTETPQANNTWLILLILGILLFLSGVGGYIFLWMNP